MKLGKMSTAALAVALLSPLGGLRGQSAGGAQIPTPPTKEKNNDKSPSQAAATHQVTSPRDVATGQASGKRQHAPGPITKEVSPANAKTTPKTTSSNSDVAPRDAASGQASGKSAQVTTAREASSGMATGKRMHKPVTIEPDRKAGGEASANQDVATGQVSGKKDADSALASGRREDTTGHASGKRETGSGMATGKSAQPTGPRDSGSGMATGKHMHKPFTVTKEAKSAAIQEGAKNDGAVKKQSPPKQ